MMRKILMVLGLAALVTACSSTNTQVKQGFTSTQKQDSYQIIPNTSNEYDVYFEQALEKSLQKAKFNQKGELSDSIIEYGLSMDEGNRALRYFVGFGAGQAKAMINVKIFNRADKKLLADLSTEATLSIGVFGGEAKGILDNAAEDIVKKIEVMNIFVRSTH